MKPFLQGIDTVILRVSNIEKSKIWYIETLALTILHEDKKINLVVLDTYGPTSLTLWEAGEKIMVNVKTSSYPIFRSQHADVVHKQLKTKGVSVSDMITDHVVTYFTFQDPDGNLLEVCQVHG